MGYLIVFTALLLTPVAAGAFSGGITGFSGRNGQSCAACHAGGSTPQVRIEGPTQLPAGKAEVFRLVVESTAPGGQDAAGLDVAASGGQLASIAGQGTRLSLNEITHSAPKSNTGNVATFDFTWRAPANTGNQTLFAAGNSVNLDRNSTGDRSNTTTHVIEVVPADTPTPTETAVPVDTVTPTPTQTEVPSATRTPTNTPRPTRTATVTTVPGRCTGDCNNDSSVTVDELVRGTMIGLGTRSLDTCPNADPSGDDRVTIEEMVQAILSARRACGATPAP